MLSESGLDKPGWKYIFADESGRQVVARLESSVRGKVGESFELFKTTTGRRRIYLFSPAGSAEKYLLKAYLPARFSKRLKYLVRNSRCRQEFVAAKKLAELKIPAVRAPAFGYRMSGLLPAEELVIEPYLSELKNFSQLWQEAGAEQRKKLFISLAGLVSLMHRKGVLQRDFKPDSILVRQVNDSFELVVADLERIKFYRRPLARNHRIANLGKIMQAFFRAEECEEWEWLLEAYSLESGMNFREGVLRRAVLASGVRQSKKQAEQRRSWAAETNELIEKFEHNGAEIRVSREIGRELLEKFLAQNLLPASGTVEISGKKLELFAAASARAVMEDYFYLRELRIPVRPVVLAIDRAGKGLAGVLVDPSEKPLIDFQKTASAQDSAQIAASLKAFSDRLQLFGISLPSKPEQAILVKPSLAAFSLCLSRPDILGL